MSLGQTKVPSRTPTFLSPCGIFLAPVLFRELGHVSLAIPQAPGRYWVVRHAVVAEILGTTGPLPPLQLEEESFIIPAKANTA